MSELFRLLVLYYACDLSAETQFPSPEEWKTCMGHYHEIKSHFAGELEGPSAQIEGYARWKDWEAANPDVVRALRDRAG